MTVFVHKLDCVIYYFHLFDSWVLENVIKQYPYLYHFFQQMT
jgi:hypothetical protein